MGSFTLSPIDSQFPEGTSVSAYNSNPATGKPTGSIIATATTAGNALTFTGLTEGLPYQAVAQISGTYRYVGFYVPALSTNPLLLTPTTAGRNTVQPTAGIDPLNLLTSTDVTNANVPAYHIPVGSQAFRTETNGRVHIGENRLLKAADAIGSTMHNSILDFLYDPPTSRIYARSAIYGEVGDSPEIQLRRAGPDNNGYPYPSGGGLAGIASGTTLGQITWYPFQTPNGGTPNVTTGASIGNPSGGIYMQAAQDQFPGKAGGRMYFATTPNNAGNYVTSLVIDQNQHIYNGSGSDLARFSITGKAGDEASVVGLFRAADAQTASIFKVQGTTHADAFQVSAAGNVTIGDATLDTALLRLHTSTDQLALEVRVDSGQTAKLMQAVTGSTTVLDLDKNGVLRLLGANASLDIRGTTGSGFIQLGEQSIDPSAPAADKGVVFMRDNGSGKTQFCARFPTGAVQVLATEP